MLQRLVKVNKIAQFEPQLDVLTLSDPRRVRTPE
jgi:hypothetical protein